MTVFVFNLFSFCYPASEGEFVSINTNDYIRHHCYIPQQKEEEKNAHKENSVFDVIVCDEHHHFTLTRTHVPNVWWKKGHLLDMYAMLCSARWMYAGWYINKIWSFSHWIIYERIVFLCLFVCSYRYSKVLPGSNFMKWMIISWIELDIFQLIQTTYFLFVNSNEPNAQKRINCGCIVLSC